MQSTDEQKYWLEKVKGALSNPKKFSKWNWISKSCHHLVTFISYRAMSNTKILKPLMQGLGWLKAELLMGDSLKGENKNERLKVNFWKQTTSSSRNDDDDAYWRLKINNVEYHNKRESARMFMLGWMEGERNRERKREREKEKERERERERVNESASLWAIGYE